MTVLLANQLAAEMWEYVQRLISLASTPDVYLLQGPVFHLDSRLRGNDGCAWVSIANTSGTIWA